MKGPMNLQDDDEYERWSIVAWVVVVCMVGAALIVLGTIAWGSR